MPSGAEPVLVFDIGGSHVSAALYHAVDSSLGPTRSEDYTAVHTSTAFVDLLAGLASATGYAANPFAGAMLAVPGPFDLEAGISRMQHKLAYLFGFDLRCALARRLGCEPRMIRFLHDADAFLLGEVGAGAGRGFDRAVGLTLGTGIGSAFAVHGRLIHQGDGVPDQGEIWNLPYEDGIVEDRISTRAIVARYKRQAGEQRQVVEIAGTAAADPAARAAFEEMGGHLGRVIRSLLAPFRPDVVVLGGGIARSSGLFLPATRSELSGFGAELRVSELLDRAPLAGCGVAWFQKATP